MQLLKRKEVRMFFFFWSIQSLFLRRPCLFVYAILIPHLLRVRVHNFSTCTTFDLLSGGVLSLVFVKKHNFVVFCFIRMFTFGSTRHLRSLRLSLLTSCVVRSPTNGMVSQIVESWLSREVSLVL